MSASRVLDERIRSRVLEPLDAVIRLHDPIVERITVREDHVEVAVLVEIDELDARRSPVGMRRGVDHFLIEREVARAAIDEGDHGLVFLREQDDEVHVTILVQIDRDDVDGACTRIDDMRLERRLVGIRDLILENRDVSRSCGSRTPPPPDRACHRR